MNFFGQNDAAAQPTGPDPLFAATAELEMYTDLFSRISSTCFSKCASRRHKDQDLALGEMACTDRCTGKFMEAMEKVGVVLQKANEAQASQQKAMGDMQAAWAGGGAGGAPGMGGGR
uniref:Mitochondrial import inner membrane translocase subunit n=1 Tax=Odontella aurita TaxID=265563 RepID=A0A7S4MYY8_9STRA|mmetsp:Transcript_3970/g.10983  ORF Transcript_3970/g.10983 Transcript_3970/m.10983 type:complete len:117 (+) Transcript_3970:136-486(+)|eukprot:CAMPEP_0113573488 /NCGR_PEP_ID=MMETSP0015_2-20120614/26645_1 /TAXON_ID=2838 /ORGANISM="Odontella" /LENGTH=116 /DNA_ID=CAMNT_0000476571 /DNA_START=25 /DNA_END=375 /DNA_ORIENTATION=- /assembly_acc=CAM_ASM_000160